jgi:hypothetical protein
MSTEKKDRALRLLKIKDIVKRIDEFVNLKGESLYELTKNLGFSAPYFTRAKAGTASFGAEAIFLILERYRDLDPDWLLFGTGSKFRGGVKAEKKELATKTELIKIDKNTTKRLEKAKKMKQMFLNLADETQKEIDGFSKLS